MKRISLRAKYLFLIVVFFIGGFGLLLMVTQISKWFIVAEFMFVIIWGINFIYLLKCTKCGKNILLNPIKIGRFEIWVWTPLFPEKCSKCDTEID